MLRAAAARLITQRPVLVLALAALLTAGALWPLRRARVDPSLDRAVPADSPARRDFIRLQRIFRLDEPVLVAVDAGTDVFSADFLQRLRRFTRALAHHPQVAEVRSLLSAKTVQGAGETLTVRAAVPPASTATPRTLARAARLVVRDPLLRDLVSRDRRATLVTLHLRPPRGELTEEELAQQVTRAIQTAAAQTLAPSTIHLSGLPYLRGKLVQTIQHELGTIAVANAVVIGLLLILVFRSLPGLLVPLTAMGVAVSWVMGGMVLCGKTIDVYTGMIPSLLLIIGVLDVIYLMSEYQRVAAEQPDRREAVRQVLQRLMVPCALTSLTTALGFAAITLNPVPIIRDAGLVIAIGILVTYLVVMTVVPALLCLWPPPALRPGWSTGSTTGRVLALLGRGARRRASATLVVTGLLLGLTAWGISQLRVESEFVRYFDDDDPVARAGRFIDHKLGGSVGFDLVLETGRAGGVLEPRMLAALDQLARTLRRDPRVGRVSAATDALLQLKRSLTGRAALPRSRAEAAQLLLLLESEGSTVIDPWLAQSGATARISVRTPSLPSRELVQLAHEARSLARRLSHKPVLAAGQHLTMLETADHIVDGQIRSFAVSCAGLVLVIAVIFRSLGLGLLALIPNVLPVLGGMALMAAAGVTLNNVTAINAAVGLGIAVDDTIHMLARYRAELRRAPGRALEVTVVAVGRPVLLSTVVLCLGFATLMLSTFRNNADTGLIASSTLAIALVADLLLLPVLLSLLGPRLLGRRSPG